MCAEAVTGAEVVILDISNNDKPFLSIQTPYVYFKFTYPQHDRFCFSTSPTDSLSASYAKNLKRGRPYFDDEDYYQRPDKRRRLRLQVASSTLSAPYSYPPQKKGMLYRPTAAATRAGFQAMGIGKLPKMKGDLIRKTAILNKIRRDGLSRDQELVRSTEEKKADVLRRHRMLFEGYQADPLHNPPPSAEILEERWEADDIPRYEDDQPDDYEEYGWTYFQ